MSARTMPIFLTAAWREAVRAREPYIDLDHLLLGLIAAGGPAAQTLAQHGLDLIRTRSAAQICHAEAVGLLGVDVHALPTAAPRSISELNQDASRMPMTERLDQFVNKHGVRAAEHALLTSLLIEPSGTICELVRRSGADPEALMEDVNESAAWTTPTPQRAYAIEAEAGPHIAAVQLAHFIPVDPRLVRSVAADPTLAPQCLMFPDTLKGEGDGTLAMSVSKRGRTTVLSLALSANDEGRVRWDTRWDDQPSGWFEIVSAPVDGGTLMTLIRAVRPIGIVGAALTAVIRWQNGVGLVPRAQNISLACADAMDRNQ